MSKLKEWLRVSAALVLIALGAVIAIFYRQEEFGLVIGAASTIVGSVFLWRSWPTTDS